MDRYIDLRGALEAAVLRGPGQTTEAQRRAAAAGTDDPIALSAYLEKVRRHAWQVTDDDVTAAQGAGWSDDALFELTTAASYGAARRRLDAAMGAVDIFYARGGRDAAAKAG